MPPTLSKIPLRYVYIHIQLLCQQMNKLSKLSVNNTSMSLVFQVMEFLVRLGQWKEATAITIAGGAPKGAKAVTDDDNNRSLQIAKRV